MNNYNKALDYQTGLTNSAGKSNEAYSKYLDGVEAATNRLTDASNKLWQATINSGLIVFLINATTNSINLVSALGGLIPVVTTLIGLIFLLNIEKFSTSILKLVQNISLLGGSALINGIKTLVFEIGNGVSAMDALGIAFGTATVAAAPFIVVLLALAAAYEAIKLASPSVADFSANLDKANTAVSDVTSKINGIRDSISSIQGLSDEFDTLQDKIAKLGDVTKLSTDEQKKFTDIQNQLKSIIPELAGSYDAEGNFIVTETTKLGPLVELKQKELDIEEQLLKIKQDAAVDAAQKSYDADMQKLKDLQEAQKALMSKTVVWVSPGAENYISDGIDSVNTQLTEQQLLVQKDKLSLDLMTQGLYDDGHSLVYVAEQANKTSDALDGVASHSYSAFADATKVLSGFVDANNALGGFDFSPLISQDQSFIKIMDDMKTNSAITIEQVQALQKASVNGKDYLQFVTEVGGQYKLNTEALKQYMVEEVNQVILAMQIADKTNALIPILQAYRDELVSGATDPAAAQKAYQDILKDTIDMIKQQVEAQKSALQQELQDYTDTINAEKAALDSKYEDQKSKLQSELDGYKSIIDARKKILDQLQAEQDYKDKIAEQTKAISDIDNELLQLQFDNSDEAKAKRLQLEDDKTKALKDLNKTQSDYEFTSEKNALDAELQSYQDNITKKEKALDDYHKKETAALDAQLKTFKANIDAKIKALDAYLSQTGTITQDAIALIQTHTNTFYQSLMDWNKKFGSGVDDLTSKWELALSVIQQAQSAAQNLYNNPPPGSYLNHTVPGFDSGGWVGGAPQLKSNQMFAQLMEGERVVTPDEIKRFMSQTLPSMVATNTTNNNQGNIEINVPVVIYGNPDKNLVDTMTDKIFDKINKALQIQGHTRTGMAFSV